LALDLRAFPHPHQILVVFSGNTKVENPTTSSVYKIVREEGIFDGLARGFKRDINMYKPEYKVSRNMLRMVQQS